MAGALVLRRKTTSPIGLDVGQTAARAVQLVSCDGACTLLSATAWHFSAEETSATKWDTLSERLRRALRQQDFSGRALAAGLSQPDLELHALELPRGEKTDAPGNQINSAAHWEIERLSRFEDQATQTDHWWLPPGRGARTTAIGAAVPRDTVQRLWDACHRAGADCRRVDATACALSRAGSLLRTPDTNDVWGVLDIGARATRLVLCVDETPALARLVESGGQGWTDRIAASLQVSSDAAERHKRDHGIRPAGGRFASGGGRRPAEAAPAPLTELAVMIFGALRPELDQIAGEVERSYEYVLQSCPGRKAGELILAGGGAALKQLSAYLSDRLGICVRTVNECLEAGESRLTVDASLGKLRESIGAFLGAVGLAIPPEHAG